MQHELTIVGDVLLVLIAIAIVVCGVVCVVCYSMNKPGGGSP